MFVGCGLIFIDVIRPLPTPTPVVLVNKLEFSSGNDSIVLLLSLTLILLMGGIALFFWLLKKGRLRIVADFSGEQGKSITTLFQNERNRAGTLESEGTGVSIPARGPHSAERPSPPADPLGNRQWLGLVRECAALYDELDTLLPSLDPARQEMAKHVQLRLTEILGRSGVEVIVHDQFFDIRRHKLAAPGPAVAPKTSIAETVSPGFAVKQLVIRPARVRVDRAVEG